MRKIVKIDVASANAGESVKKQMYLYRIASVNVDKVTLEKHIVSIMNTFEDKEMVAELDDSTRVGTVTQKVTSSLIPTVSKSVDEVVSSFEMNEKVILSIDFKGVKSVVV